MESGTELLQLKIVKVFQNKPLTLGPRTCLERNREEREKTENLRRTETTLKQYSVKGKDGSNGAGPCTATMARTKLGERLSFLARQASTTQPSSGENTENASLRSANASDETRSKRAKPVQRYKVSKNCTAHCDRVR